jgi:hypothetical protein
MINLNAIIENAPKGANIVCEWERDAKVKVAGRNLNIRKAVRMVGRVGLTYDNLKAVKEKRETGELPKENAGLQAWAEWLTFPFLLGHKTKGTQYLRLYKGTSKKVAPSVSWTMNSKAVDKEEIACYLQASELKKSEGDCFMVKVADLKRVWIIEGEAEGVA